MDLTSLIDKATTLARDNSHKLRKLGLVGDTLAELIGDNTNGSGSNGSTKKPPAKRKPTTKKPAAKKAPAKKAATAR